MNDESSVLITPRAERDLEAIFDYGYQKFGRVVAECYLDRLTDTFPVLLTKPLPSTGYSHVRPGLKGYRIRSHIVFYRAIAGTVVIVRVLHKSMDLPRHLLDHSMNP